MPNNSSGMNSGNDLTNLPPKAGDISPDTEVDYSARTNSPQNPAEKSSNTDAQNEDIEQTTSPHEMDVTIGSAIGHDSLGRTAIGSIVDRKYELIALLGTGGMSSVYKAKHLFMHKTVAVKLMHPRLLSETQSLRRFQHEARAASRISHPNAITIHEFGITGEQPYIIMDYLEGASFADLIKKEGKVDAERCLHIFMQACDALAEAHDRGIVHRDLKPSNIMLTVSGADNYFVKVVDFGIAKIVSEGGDSLKLTSTGEVFGSPLYMSPEQCMGQILDARSDIYSMGCLMYEALTGKPPFTGNNVLETILKQTSEPAPGLGEISGDVRVVQKLDAIVLKCLSKDPEERYQSMNELKEDLETAAQSATSGWKSLAQIGRQASQVERNLARRVGRPKRTTILLLAVCVFVAAFAVAVISLVVPGVGSTISERELPLEPVIAKNIAPVNPREEDVTNRLWKQLSQNPASESNNLERTDEALKKFSDLARRYKAWGNYAPAALNYERALALCIPLHLENSLLAVELLNSRAECNLNAGGSFALKTARDAAIRSVDVLRSIGKESSSEALVAHANLGQAFYRLRDLDQAKANFQRVKELFFAGAFKGLDSATLALILAESGRFYLDIGDSQNAFDLLEHGEVFWANVQDRAVLNMASIKNDIGMSQDLRGKHGDAQELYETANTLLSSFGSRYDMYRAKILMNLSDSYFKSGDWMKALKARMGAHKASLRMS